VRFCTTVTRSYVAQARVLAESLSAHHGGERLAVLVTDDVDRELDAAKEPFTLLRTDDLSLPPDEITQLAVVYDAKELATAFKPWLLRRLLQDEPAAIFLDPDVQVFAPLDDLLESAVEHGVLLTPHSLTPIPFDGQTPTELHVQRSGIFNTGFLGVGRSAGAFLDWFAERLRLDSIIDYSKGLFVDQRWVDFVPAYFEHLIVRDPGCNVAYWNLHERTLEERGDGIIVNGRPLRFFHFSGFDPTRPELLTWVASRIRPEPGTVLARLCNGYAERLVEHGYRELAGEPYGLATADGVRLTRARRRLYRAALRQGEQGGAPPPAPHEPGFGEWFEAVEAGDGVAASEWAHVLLDEKPDLSARRPVVASARRVLQRLLRPQLEHEEALARALVAVVEEAGSRLERRIAELDARVDALASRR
jgi:hypothetical protein